MKKDYWIYKVFLLTFFIALILSGFVAIPTTSINTWLLLAIIILVMTLGIVFDIISMAVLTAKKSTFHAKAAKKIKGAKEALTIVQNAPKIVTITGDIVGDVCGIVSGGLGAIYAINISTWFGWNVTIVSMVVTAIISSLMVGFKALTKKIGLKKCDEIVYSLGKIMHFLKFK